MDYYTFSVYITQKKENLARKCKIFFVFCEISSFAALPTHYFFSLKAFSMLFSSSTKALSTCRRFSMVVQL